MQERLCGIPSGDPKLRQQRWLTESVFANEQEARGLCASLLRGPVRSRAPASLKETTRGGNAATENIMLYRDARPREGIDPGYGSRVGAGLRARRRRLQSAEPSSTLLRVLRQYFEKVLLTPTEVLHNYKEFMRLQDFGTLVVSAVGRIAAGSGRGRRPPTRWRRAAGDAQRDS